MICCWLVQNRSKKYFSMLFGLFLHDTYYNYLQNNLDLRKILIIAKVASLWWLALIITSTRRIHIDGTVLWRRWWLCSWWKRSGWVPTLGEVWLCHGKLTVVLRVVVTMPKLIDAQLLRIQRNWIRRISAGNGRRPVWLTLGLLEVVIDVRDLLLVSQFGAELVYHNYLQDTNDNVERKEDCDKTYDKPDSTECPVFLEKKVFF